MTYGNMIVIGTMDFSVDMGEPFEFDGVHSGRKLSGFKLRFYTESIETSGELDELQAEAKREGRISVSDPFAGREYMATLQLRISSSSPDRARKDFEFEIKELDISPAFDDLEVGDLTFTVIQSAKKMHGSENDGVYALVSLSEEEFWQFHRLRNKSVRNDEPVAIRRVGVDEESSLWRFGGALYWSKHEDAGEIYYKQIVGFFPYEDTPDEEDSERAWNIAPAVEMFNAARAHIHLACRFEALLNTLANSGQISSEMRDEILMVEDPTTLLDPNRVRQITTAITKVVDASEYFE